MPLRLKRTRLSLQRQSDIVQSVPAHSGTYAQVVLGHIAAIAPQSSISVSFLGVQRGGVPVQDTLGHIWACLDR